MYLRKYKFWKQFTTIRTSIWKTLLLRCIYENTNFESNSQLTSRRWRKVLCCVVSTKIQILKAIHNKTPTTQILIIVALYLRKYKFWKQFTTCKEYSENDAMLRCIYENTNFESNSQPSSFPVLLLKGCVVSTKIQILKAIHNLKVPFRRLWKVALYLRKYKFWKQFTTILTITRVRL